MNPEELAAAIAAALKPFGEQLTALGTTVAALKVTPPATTTVTPPATTTVTPPVAAATLTPEQNAEFVEMKKQMAASAKKVQDLEEANKAAGEAVLAEKQRTAVNAALEGFSFATPDAKMTAFDKLNAQVKRTDDGSLIAGDNLPVEAFAKDFIPTHSYLLAPEVRGGSGASGGTRTAVGGKVATLESIKVGMSKDDLAAASSATLAVLNSING